MSNGMSKCDYFEKLNEIYEKECFSNGCCVNWHECRKGMCEDGLFFNRAKVGSKYGNGDYPKVLFVGKEAVTEQHTIKHMPSLDEAHNPHYRGLLYTLARLYKESPQNWSYENIKEYQSLLDYCALTNYFKCAFTQTRVADGEKKSVKHSKIETNHAMEQNCYNLLFCELDTLTPKFVVIQGKFYKSKQFYSEVERKYKEDDLKGRCKKGYIQWTKHKYSSGDSFYILWTYHPAAKGAYCWNKVVDDLNAAIEMLIRSCLF